MTNGNLRELDPMDASRPRPGQIEGWASTVAWAGAVVTLIICFAAPRLLANQGDDPVLETGWFLDGLGLGAIALLALAFLPVARTQRSLRIAAVLPFLHLLGLGVAWVGWSKLSSKIEGARGLTPLVEALPLGYVLGTVGAFTTLAALIVARRRRREVLHAMVMISLVGLFLLGAWLPLVAAGVSGPKYLDSWSVDLAMVATPKLIAAILVPPFVAATLYTALALRRAPIIVRHRTKLIVLVGVLWFAAVAMRGQASEVSMVVYANYLPWLFANAFTVILAITALAAATWLSTRANRVAQHAGRVGAERGEMVAGFAITSWLRGPEPIVTAFDLATAHGELPVPASARLVAPLPLASTILRVGEIVPAVCGGDEVGVSGYEQHASGQPFRDSAAPIPSTAGVDVVPTAHERAGLEQLFLAAWRPAIAYVLVLLAVAGPALITLTNAH